MGLTVKATFKPSPSLKRTLAAMQAPQLTGVIRRSLIKCAVLASNEITTKQIIRGGRRRGPKGPRGGKGKLVSAGAHPTKLTSRSGDLRRSLNVSFGIDRSGLPKFIDVGTDLIYGPPHEFGSTKLHLPARPFIAPGFEAVSPRFADVFVDEWKRELDL